MDWKQNEGARTLHTLLSQNIRYAHKVSNLSRTMLASPDQLTKLFRNIDGERKGSMNSDDLTVFCLQNTLKFRSKQLSVIKQHFGLDSNEVTYSQFCQILQSNTYGQTQNIYESSRQPSQLFSEYLSLLVQSRQKSNKLLEVLQDQSSQLAEYFTRNMYDSYRQQLTPQLVKQFMYDTHIFSRINFNVIKKQLFSNKKVIVLLKNSKQKILCNSDEKNRGRSLKNSSIKEKVESPCKNSNVLIDSPLKKQALDSPLKRSKVNSVSSQNQKQNKPASILKNGKAKTKEEEIDYKKQSKNAQIRTLNQQIVLQCERKPKFNYREHFNDNQTINYIKKEEQSMIAPKQQVLQLESYSQSFTNRNRSNLKQVYDIQNGIRHLDMVHQLPNNFNKSGGLLRQNSYESCLGKTLQYKGDKNQVNSNLIRQTSEEHDPSSIKGTKDCFNVNSILDQINSIEKQLQQKKKRNNQKRMVIQVEQTKRSRLVGQIMSKKNIPKETLIDNLSEQGNMTQSRNNTVIFTDYNEQPNDAREVYQSSLQHQTRKSNFSRQKIVAQNSQQRKYIQASPNAALDRSIDIERRNYIQNLKIVNAGFKQSVKATSRKTIDKQSRILLPQQRNIQLEKEINQQDDRKYKRGCLYKPSLPSQYVESHIRSNTRNNREFIDNQMKIQNYEMYGLRSPHHLGYYCNNQNVYASNKFKRMHQNNFYRGRSYDKQAEQIVQFAQNLNCSRNYLQQSQQKLQNQQKYVQNRRQQLLRKASSEAKLRIQDIQRRALEKVYSRQNLCSLSKRTYDLKSLQRKMEQTVLKYRNKQKIEKKTYQYIKPAREERHLRLF